MTIHRHTVDVIAPAVLSGSCRRNTTLLKNSLYGLNDDEARRRIAPGLNNISFIALHTLDCRSMLASIAGIEAAHPYTGILEHAESLDDIIELPPIRDIELYWEQIGEKVYRQLNNLTTEQLAERSGKKFPHTGNSIFEGIEFLLNHEMYHIGQIAFIRRLIDKPSMSWS